MLAEQQLGLARLKNERFVSMIDFDEELKKFTPSEEVDKEIAKVDPEQVTDMADVLMELLKD